MTTEEIKELVQLVLDTGIAELEVARGDQRVRIRRNAKVTHQVAIPQNAAAGSEPYGPNQSTPAAEIALSAASQEDKSLIYVKSPIVGTYYESPSRDTPAFVQIGERVQPGQVLCIIESMKLMNEIEAEVAGVITKKLVENGRPVEYGETLFALRAD